MEDSSSPPLNRGLERMEKLIWLASEEYHEEI
jgi:hypothetical protein